MAERTLVQSAGLELSGNVLKIIAAVAMTADHVGLVLFPTVPVLRQIGRLALPIFAFMIAEGCAHTRNALRYFLSVLTLGLVCQTAYTVAMGSWYLCMPLSFSFAIALTLRSAARSSSRSAISFFSSATLISSTLFSSTNFSRSSSGTANNATALL